MHYYQFNIGDYLSHTAHLDPLEDIAYRRMLDWVYLHESPLPLSVKQISKYIRMTDECERITGVLQAFFIETEYGYTQRKAEAEIEKYKDKSAKAKAAVEARWAKSANKPHTNVLQTQCERNTNHKPITNNHKPIKRMALPTLDDVNEYASVNNLNCTGFHDYYSSNGWKVGKNPMKDWKAAARGWSKRQTSYQPKEDIDWDSTGWSKQA